jgi:catechol 2,3-dioxygenase-like lactoylglutathione lyase family enzyme
MICGMNHFTITAEDRARTLDFYCGLLGLVEGHRPDLGFAGSWLYAPGGGGTLGDAVLHIYWDRPMPATRTGVIDHLAFSAQGLRAVKARFDERGMTYDLRRQKDSGTWQLFSHDPNGAKVELDFAPSEEL